MKLENQVVSLELAKRLKEMGVKQESIFGWVEILEKGSTPNPHVFYRDLEKASDYDMVSGDVIAGEYAAFTTSELGEMFDGYCFTRRAYSSAKDENWLCRWQDVHGINEKKFYGKTEADARAKMLIYLLENKLITL